MKKFGFHTVRTMKGHMFTSNSGKLLIYYRYLQFLMHFHGIRNPEIWSGCLEEFKNQLGSSSTHSRKAFEIYVHPNMIDGIPMDTVFNYRGERRPVADEAALLSDLGASPANS